VSGGGRHMKGSMADEAVLKGYMYLTSHHICFFAHMPDKEVCGALCPDIKI
jgi:hypothetical protein